MDCLSHGSVFPRRGPYVWQGPGPVSPIPPGSGLSSGWCAGSTAPMDWKRALSLTSCGNLSDTRSLWSNLFLHRCYGDNSAYPPQVSERIKCADTNKGFGTTPGRRENPANTGTTAPPLRGVRGPLHPGDVHRPPGTRSDSRLCPRGSKTQPGALGGVTVQSTAHGHGRSAGEPVANGRVPRSHT